MGSGKPKCYFDYNYFKSCQPKTILQLLDLNPWILSVVLRIANKSIAIFSSHVNGSKSQRQPTWHYNCCIWWSWSEDESLFLHCKSLIKNETETSSLITLRTWKNFKIELSAVFLWCQLFLCLILKPTIWFRNCSFEIRTGTIENYIRKLAGVRCKLKL